MKLWLHLFICVCCVQSLAGCSSLIIGSALKPTLSNLQQQTDLGLVCEGAPAYLLMLDSLLASDPDNTELLSSGVQAYVGYSASLDACGRLDRAETVSEKAKQ